MITLRDEARKLAGKAGFGTAKREDLRLANELAIEQLSLVLQLLGKELHALFRGLGLGLVATQPLNIGDHIAVELGMPRQILEYIVKRCGDLPGGLFSIGCVRATAAAKAS